MGLALYPTKITGALKRSVLFSGGIAHSPPRMGQGGFRRESALASPILKGAEIVLYGYKQKLSISQDITKGALAAVYPTKYW